MTQEHMVGESAAMTNLAQAIQKAARGNWTVLIQGESGTGKGVAARAIHDRRGGASRPFVTVNCGAIPESLLESELFGHEKGAFTGADRQRLGKFEAAGAGTIFLDEIGELSLASQARLLHVLQEKEIERLGGEGRRIPIRAQVIAATNRDLDRKVADGTFRQDLYFRLNVFSLRTPPLRDHPEDIPALAHHFALRSGTEAGRSILGVSPEVLSLFQKHPWPGNVRQLENLTQRAVAVGETEHVRVEDLPEDFLSAASRPAPHRPVRNFYAALDDAARTVCIAAFAASNGSCTAAARMLGLHRNSVYRLIQRHGLHYLLGPSGVPGPCQKGETLNETRL